MIPVWSYRVVQSRVRHKRGYYFEQFQLIRSDGKIVATNSDHAVINQTKARFESWARQPWSSY